jgi:hypothetical protein
MTDRPKRKRGRPTKFYTEICAKVEKLCLLGATNEQIADFVGISTETLNEWLKSNQEFSDSIARGRHDADANVAKSLYKRATGYEHKESHVTSYQGSVTVTDVLKHVPPDTAAASLWLRNRQPKHWRNAESSDYSALSSPQNDLNAIVRRIAYLLANQELALPDPGKVIDVTAESVQIEDQVQEQQSTAQEDKNASSHS